MLEWKKNWLSTHEMVMEYLKREEMDPIELGLPFNWIMDMISTVEKHFKKEKEKEDPVELKEEFEFKRRGLQEYPATERYAKLLKEKEELGEYPYDPAVYEPGPEPYEPNPYDGTYSEE